MKSGLRIGKIIGIPIELHPSWFLIFGLLTWSLATGLLPLCFGEATKIPGTFRASTVAVRPGNQPVFLWVRAGP